jgi:peptide/nickel transport system substrate-binding protein
MDATRRGLLTAIAGMGSYAAMGGSGAGLREALAQTAERVDRSLIGKLEGPEVIVDRSRWPTSFSEAPSLARMVAGGQLPPVGERIGKDPLVIKPVHEIGRYGGTWRRGFTGPGDLWNGWRATSGPDNILFWDYTGNKVVPNIAKGWTFSPDGREMLLHLREGMRWSDGAPFTADDFMFWYDHIYGNDAIVRVKSAYLATNGKPGRMEKVDATTLRLTFADPYFFLIEVLAGATPLGGQARHGRDGMGMFAPAHYLKQFHPAFVSEAELRRQVAASGFDGWVNMFLARSNWALNPDLPVVTPWKVTVPVNRPSWEFERNPYSIWVDTAGNQLPYIDKVVFGLAENLEVINLRTIAGEYDVQERHVDIAKLPVLIRNQRANNYKVYLDPAGHGADLMIIFNHTFNADPEIGKWIGNVDFRRALSLGIKRDELNEIFWLGLGEPRSIVAEDASPLFPGPEYATLWSTHDPERAAKLLDGIGLARKDAQGYRLRTDGRGRLTLVITAYAGQSLPYTQMSEVVRNHWAEIGIDVQVNEVERTLGETRGAANEIQLLAFVGDGTDHLFNYPTVLPVLNEPMGPGIRTWYHSNGERGTEPAPYMKKALENFRKAFTATDAERIELGKEIWRLLVDNVHAIGTVGLSPAFQGIRVVKNNVGNTPARQYNSPDVKTPAISRTPTYFFKS